MTKKRARTSQSGASIVEFAIVAPIWFAIIFGMIEILSLAKTHAILSQSLKEGLNSINTSMAMPSGDRASPIVNALSTQGDLTPCFRINEPTMGQCGNSLIEYRINQILSRSDVSIDYSSPRAVTYQSFREEVNGAQVVNVNMLVRYKPLIKFFPSFRINLSASSLYIWPN
jgi:hypothetical protein